MARPPKEGMDYFPHDVTASADKKIEALRALHGNNGYVFYFIMLEQIYQEANFELDISDAEMKEDMIQILARKIQITIDEFKQILNTALKWGCFDKKLFDEKGILTSDGIKKRAGLVLAKRRLMRDRYHQGKGKISDAETTPETRGETPQSKRKVKDKDKEYGHDSAEYSLAEFLFSRIRENNSTFKEPDLQKWAHDMDLLLRIDKRPLEEVREIVNFAQSNDFWKTNILSAGKLRKQYDQLKMQRDQVLGQAPKDTVEQMFGEGAMILI